jgi:amino acid transporter
MVRPVEYALLARAAPVAAAHPDRASALKRALIGPPRKSGELGKTLLSKKLALPVFASDPLSSVAYATEAALVVLVGASAAAAGLVLPIAIAIAAVMALVVLSYTQTVKAYQTSGGAYVVARENLGQAPSLVAAAALLIDYVLTVSVSVAAGVLALTSAVPAVEGHAVGLSLAFIAMLTVANLRGVREAGVLFALPTYAFVAAMFALIATGIGECARGGCPQAVTPDPIPAGAGAVGLVVVLGAFASGASALTGVESISNGVSAFRRPHGRNAALTLLAMGAIAVTLFVGVSYLASGTGARPSESVSILSEIARAVFPTSSPAAGMYYVVQGLTLGILILAANTSYQGFPRLAAVLARDRFFPQQFVNLGDRLVYSNGILVLAGLAALLIIVFHANVIALIHLYVIGVFTAFTISQAGMVRHWFRTREPGWRRSALMNGAGAVATGVVDVLVIEAKFLDGAWMVVFTVPLLVALFLGVNRHYRIVGRRLQAGAAAVRAAPQVTNSLVLFVDDFDPAARLAAWYARQVTCDGYRPIYVHDERSHSDATVRWSELGGNGVPIERLDRHESAADAVLDYIWALPRGESRFLTVVIPEFFERPSLVSAVGGHRTTFSLKVRLLSEPGIVITDVPVVAGQEATPSRAAARVLVTGVQAASLRALNYARSLGLSDSCAVFFAFDEEDRQRITQEWEREAVEFPLDIVDAPYRDLGEPLLRYLRGLTDDPALAVSVVMPELVFPGWGELLHNQHALYVKRLLLFEPRVFLSIVPYHLP